jgi:ABC-type transport system involved in cytochrome bd biosynthesis fused ATPase/permease subunit
MFKTISSPLGSGGRLSGFLSTDPEAPRPMQQAVRWMFAGAGVSLISLILSIAFAFSFKSGLIAANQQNLQDHKLTMSQITSFANEEIISQIVFGIIAVGLWIWMAKMNGAGKSWARIASTVFFALFTIDTFITVSSIKGDVSVTASWILSMALLLGTWVIGMAVIALLWRPVSTAWFKSRT